MNEPLDLNKSDSNQKVSMVFSRDIQVRSPLKENETEEVSSMVSDKSTTFNPENLPKLLQNTDCSINDGIVLSEKTDNESKVEKDSKFNQMNFPQTSKTPEYPDDSQLTEFIRVKTTQNINTQGQGNMDGKLKSSFKKETDAHMKSNENQASAQIPSNNYDHKKEASIMSNSEKDNTSQPTKRISSSNDKSEENEAERKKAPTE